jgi:phosphoglycolate phosphatase
MTGNGASLHSPIPFPSRLEALIFDLDGTLIDSAVAIAASLDQIARQRGIAPVTAQQVSRLVSKGAPEMVATCLNSQNSQEDLTLFRAIYGGRQSLRSDLYDGVFEGIARLAETGLPLGICTNKPQHLTLKILADVGLLPLFQAVVGGDETSGRKPDPIHLGEVCKRLGHDPSACALVGDSEVDEAAARALGMSFLFVSYGYVIEECRDYCRRFDDFPALTDYLFTEIAS